MSTSDYLPVLSKGAHTSPKDGACFMEYASFLAGEPFSDLPQCADQVLALVCQSVNDDCYSKTRQTLAPLIPRVIGTRQWKNAKPLHNKLIKWAFDRLVDHDAPASILNSVAFYGHEFDTDSFAICSTDDQLLLYYENAVQAILFAADTFETQAEFLTALFDKFDELTGHRSEPVPVEQWRTACQLVSPR